MNRPPSRFGFAGLVTGCLIGCIGLAASLSRGDQTREAKAKPGLIKRVEQLEKEVKELRADLSARICKLECDVTELKRLHEDTAG